jgi:hypothetical protein
LDAKLQTHASNRNAAYKRRILSDVNEKGRMTIAGDSHGDRGDLVPLAACAALPFAGGHFWALSGLEDEEGPPLPGKASSYLQSCTSSEIILSGSSRMEKRLERRRLQRLAAMELDPH